MSGWKRLRPTPGVATEFDEIPRPRRGQRVAFFDGPGPKGIVVRHEGVVERVDDFIVTLKLPGQKERFRAFWRSDVALYPAALV